MKWIHLSDLHLGKRLHGYSLLDDQAYILNEIAQIIESEQPDGVMLCGDIYDKSIPSAEVVQLFDAFVTRLSQSGQQVFILSGNHDSPERLSFGSAFMAGGVHISPVYNGQIHPISVTRDGQTADVYMLPFLKPATVRHYFPDTQIDSYTDAVRVALQGLPLRPERINILMTHQFVAGSLRSDSEEISVGGTDAVDVDVFDGFDYVALGHIHRCQNCAGTDRIRYCGTPLKYSASETDDEKTLTVAELDADGTRTLRTIALHPLHDMVRLKESYETLTSLSFYKDTPLRDNYVHITLTDPTDIPYAFRILLSIYPNLMTLRYESRAGAETDSQTQQEVVQPQSPIDLFSAFYNERTQSPMTPEQTQIVLDCLEDLQSETL